jgi:tetratricopeptide (TPR) repeat protein
MLVNQDKRFLGVYLTETSVCVALSVLTLLVYCPTFHHPFVNYDDPVYVSQNSHVRSGLTLDGIRWAFTTFDCGNWHPLTWLSLQLDCTLYGGLKPGGFHLTNVLLHTANTLLLFLVFSRMTAEVGRSAVVAALFALHPLHVESVAWVAERKDVLSTLFWMLTLAAYLDYVRRPGTHRYLLVFLSLGLGLLAKPMLVTLPCVLLLLDYWPLRRWRRASEPAPAPAGATSSLSLPPPASFSYLIIEKLPLFALVLASCLVTFRAQLQGQAVARLEAFPLTARVGNALLAYVGYLGKMFWPMHLAVYYPHPGPSVSGARVLGAGLLLVILTVLVLGPGRRWPYLAVGWLWYLGTLVPVIGLVQVGSQGMADRYTYVPLIGLFLLLTWGAADLAAAWNLPRHYPIAATAVVLSGCVVLTWFQVGHWQSNQHLWEHAVGVTEKNVLAHMNLGFCYQEQGRISDARREYEKAVAIAPELAVPHVNLGNIFAEVGLADRAADEYQKAIELAPELASPHFALGNLLAQVGRWEEARAEFHKSIDLDPEIAASHGHLGKLLWDLGWLKEAEAEYRRAVDLASDDPRAHNNLGITLVLLGRAGEAIAEYRRAVTLDPGEPSFHKNLGAAFQEEGRLEEALAEYHEALELGDKQVRPRLQACERMLSLRPRLPDLIAGRDQPANNTERLALAELCRQPGERRYALAARFYADAFRADESLADDLRSANRFHAALAAAAAGCGQGQDAARLDEQEKARLRRQALNWLQADLALWSKQAQDRLASNRATVQQVLRVWQNDARLAGVRDPAALAKQPKEERATWRKLWEEVETVLAKASTPMKSP